MGENLSYSPGTFYFSKFWCNMSSKLFLVSEVGLPQCAQRLEEDKTTDDDLQEENQNGAWIADVQNSVGLLSTEVVITIKVNIFSTTWNVFCLLYSTDIRTKIHKC